LSMTLVQSAYFNCDLYCGLALYHRTKQHRCVIGPAGGG
jgi:hypothetical protein